jgi:hypothetical protein
MEGCTDRENLRINTRLRQQQQDCVIQIRSGGCAEAVELVRDWRDADGTMSRDF